MKNHSHPRMDDGMFSMALYPLFLFPSLITIVNYLKNDRTFTSRLQRLVNLPQRQQHSNEDVVDQQEEVSVHDRTVGQVSW